MGNEPNGWKEWSKYVLKELERLNTCYEKLDDKVDKIDKRLTLAQVKLAGLSAAVAIVVTLAMTFLRTLMMGG